MKTCKNCDSVNSDSVLVCKDCGAPLVSAVEKKAGIHWLRKFNVIALSILAFLFLIALTADGKGFFNFLIILLISLLGVNSFAYLWRTYKRYGERRIFFLRVFAMACALVFSLLSGWIYYVQDNWYTASAFAKSLLVNELFARDIGLCMAIAFVLLGGFATLSVAWILSYRRTKMRAIKTSIGGVETVLPPAAQGFDRLRLISFVVLHFIGAIFPVFLVWDGYVSKMRDEVLWLPLFLLAVACAVFGSLEWVRHCIYKEEPSEEGAPADAVWRSQPLDQGNKILLPIFNLSFAFFTYVVFREAVSHIDDSVFGVAIFAAIISFVVLVCYNFSRHLMQTADDDVVYHARLANTEEDEDGITVDTTLAEEDAKVDDENNDITETVTDTRAATEKLATDDPTAGHKPLLNEGYTFSSLFSSLCERMPSADVAYLRGLLAAMASSRLLLFADNSLPMENTLPAVSESFGAPFFLFPIAADESRTVASLAYTRDPETGYRVRSLLYEGCAWAGRYPNRAFFIGLSKIGEDNLTTLSSLTPYLRKPFERAVLFGGKDEASAYDVLVVAENTWFFAECTHTLPAKMGASLAAVCAVLPARHGAESPVSFEENAPSVSLFLRVCAAVEDAYGLEEETWKNMDALEGYLHDTYGFSFDNKLLRAFERYIAVYMACGGNETEALDAALAAKLLPVVAGLKPLCESSSSVDEEEMESREDLSAVLERLFGLDKLPLSVDFMRLMNGSTDA